MKKKPELALPFILKNSSLLRAAIAQWIRMCLPSFGPGFEFEYGPTPSYSLFMFGFCYNKSLI